MVFVVRDFVQREMGHRVLVLMALAIAGRSTIRCR